MTNRSRTAPQSDGGFSLIELLIVVVLTGILMPVIVAVFTTIVRNSPSVETRADDSRTTRGLSTWLPQDVLSTPPIPAATPPLTPPTPPVPGYNLDTARGSDCAVPLGTTNIVHMVWQENVGITPATLITYVANYRYITIGTTLQIKRYTCSGSGSGPFANTKVYNVTTRIKDTSSALATAFPAAPNPLQFIDVKVQTISGVEVLIRSSSRNPAKNLP